MKICHFLFYTLLIASRLFTTSVNAQTYEVIDLGTLGGVFSIASAINDSGKVAGTSSILDGNTHAFLWQDGVIKDLGTLGGNYSYGTGINESGQVVGYANRTDDNLHAFLWQNGVKTDLGTLGGSHSWGYAINDSGQMVGRANTEVVMGPSGTYQKGYAFLWQNGAMSNLGTLSGVCTGTSYCQLSEAFDINNSGQVVGYAPLADNSLHAFLWQNGAMSDLGTLGGSLSYARSINDSGKVVGYSYLAGNSVYHAFLWHNGVMNDLNSLIDTSTGWVLKEAMAINNLGQIVGSGTLNGQTRLYLWQKGAVSDLNALINPDSGWVLFNGTAINNAGQIVGSGTHNGQTKAFLLQPSPRLVISLRAGELFIAGEKDTIKWVGGQKGEHVDIEYSVDNGIIYTLIDFSIPSDSNYYLWVVPKDLLTTKARIKISSNTSNAVSDSFKIKPYVLTRIDENGNYYEYRKDRDQWGFSNITDDIFPTPWYNQFDYRKTDPFTGSQYSSWQANQAFNFTAKHYFPDWISWVNAFTVDESYYSTFLGIYKERSVLTWFAINPNIKWNGSCFGIAVSNALAFSHREEFTTKYQIFPEFINPISVVSDSSVKRVVNELYTHQLGASHLNYRSNIGLNKTPTQTLNELKTMFSQDTAQIRTLSFLNNGPGGGGHAILAYGMEKDSVNNDMYHIIVYDNSNPASNNRITINTAANGGNGNWINPDWPGWGGDKWIYLRNPTIEYLINTKIDPALSVNSLLSMDDNEVQIINRNSSVKITDGSGNNTGFYDNQIHSFIPGSVPLVFDDATVSPPYGYSLPEANYSVTLNAFTSDSIETFFFSKNKIFSYAREGAEAGQTDKISFNGGISVANTDAQPKKIQLITLVEDSSQEKMFVIKSLQLSQGDSVRIENTENSSLKIISYGTAKEYDIEVNIASVEGTGRFNDFKIPLTENSTHIVEPDWTNLGEDNLVILVDEGNNGTIEDTVKLENKVTGVGNKRKTLSKPEQFYLGQNYPNPFNPTTTVAFSLPTAGMTTLKVYDVLGREVAVLVNEVKEAGNYSAIFNASNLSSGIYFYTLKAGNYSSVKKMMIVK